MDIRPSSPSLLESGVSITMLQRTSERNAQALGKGLLCQPVVHAFSRTPPPPPPFPSEMQGTRVPDSSVAFLNCTAMVWCYRLLLIGRYLRQKPYPLQKPYFSFVPDAGTRGPDQQLENVRMGRPAVPPEGEWTPERRATRERIRLRRVGVPADFARAMVEQGEAEAEERRQARLEDRTESRLRFDALMAAIDRGNSAMESMGDTLRQRVASADRANTILETLLVENLYTYVSVK
uniref:Uncharacterized protein n=1 Tax=Sphaerodactylus townsendi TaxID=933632 RepID=A0ACB8EFC2_9SAUR